MPVYFFIRLDAPDLVRQDPFFYILYVREIIINEVDVGRVNIGKHKQFVSRIKQLIFKKIFHVRILPEYITVQIVEIGIADPHVELLL